MGSYSTFVIVAWAGFMVALERRFPYDKQPFFRREFWTDLLWFSTTFSMLMGWAAYAIIIPAIDHLTGWGEMRGLRVWPIWAQVGVSLFSHDLFIYCFHRTMHRSPTLWRIHEAHHSVLDVDWIGGSRGHVIENLITGTAELAPIMLFMSPEVAVIKPAIDACWGMWIHSNVDISLGPLDYVINGPRMHRWHHAREVRDVNFATKFAFWDWMFKTAYAPKDARPKSYGLDEPFPGNIFVQQLFAFRRRRLRPVGERPRVLFICGSPNQTTQMHAIARELPEVECWFTPYYSDGVFIRLLLRLGFLESAILGFRRRNICLDYLNAHGLPVDLCAERNEYDICVSCNDQVIPDVLRQTPWVLVQEGIQEPPNWRTRLWRLTRAVPMPLTGTATFGLTNRYDRFCVASEGYRRRYLAEGIAPEKLVVTGIPNFDHFAGFRDNGFPHQGYVLVCTSDARETWLDADRQAVLERAVGIAAGRPLIFKLHPNENVERATREIRAAAPDALVFDRGSAEEMVANCDVLITEWSSLTFCGVALGKEVHTLHSLDEVKELLPVQNGRAAQEIARVVRDLVSASRSGVRASSRSLSAGWTPEVAQP